MNIEVKITTDEEKEALTFIKANDLFFVIWDTLQEMRSKIKYEEIEGVELDAYEHMRTRIYEMIQERGLGELFE